MYVEQIGVCLPHPLSVLIDILCRLSSEAGCVCVWGGLYFLAILNQSVSDVQYVRLILCFYPDKLHLEKVYQKCPSNLCTHTHVHTQNGAAVGQLE